MTFERAYQIFKNQLKNCYQYVKLITTELWLCELELKLQSRYLMWNCLKILCLKILNYSCHLIKSCNKLIRWDALDAFLIVCTICLGIWLDCIVQRRNLWIVLHKSRSSRNAKLNFNSVFSALSGFCIQILPHFDRHSWKCRQSFCWNVERVH